MNSHKNIYRIVKPNNLLLLTKNNILYLQGNKGYLKFPILSVLNLIEKNKIIYIISKSKQFNTLTKNFYILLKNIFLGINNGFFSQLNCKGLGYKAKVEHLHLVFKLGFSHKLYFKIPKDIRIFCPKSNNIIFFGTNKFRLFNFMHKIQNFKKPDNYKSKGLVFKFEVIKLKEGKKI